MQMLENLSASDLRFGYGPALTILLSLRHDWIPTSNWDCPLDPQQSWRNPWEFMGIKEIIAETAGIAASSSGWDGKVSPGGSLQGRGRRNMWLDVNCRSMRLCHLMHLMFRKEPPTYPTLDVAPPPSTTIHCPSRLWSSDHWIHRSGRLPVLQALCTIQAQMPDLWIDQSEAQTLRNTYCR